MGCMFLFQQEFLGGGPECLSSPRQGWGTKCHCLLELCQLGTGSWGIPATNQPFPAGW